MTILELIERHQKETGHAIIDARCGFCQLAVEIDRIKERRNMYNDLRKDNLTMARDQFAENIKLRKEMENRDQQIKRLEELLDSSRGVAENRRLEIAELNREHHDKLNELSVQMNELHLEILQLKDRVRYGEEYVKLTDPEINCGDKEQGDAKCGTCRACALNEVERLKFQVIQTKDGHEMGCEVWQLAPCDCVYGEVRKLRIEVERLKSGKFTAEELDNLCHETCPASADAFAAGCCEYQKKLFGYSPTEETIKQLKTSGEFVGKCFDERETALGKAYHEIITVTDLIREHFTGPHEGLEDLVRNLLQAYIADRHNVVILSSDLSAAKRRLDRFGKMAHNVEKSITDFMNEDSADK